MFTRGLEPEELNKEIRNKIAEEVALKLLLNAGLTNRSKLDDILIESSHNIIANFKIKALKSYNKTEFEDKIPKELRSCLDRDFVMIPYNEVAYHEGRVNYLKNLSKVIEKDPAILKGYEQFLLKFFYENIVFSHGPPNTFSNAWLQTQQLEANIADLYTLLSTKMFGFDRYITGLDYDGKIYSKPTPKLPIYNAAEFYHKFHSHAPVLLSSDPEPFQDLIPNNVFWASNPKRLEDYFSESNGKIGNDMLRIGHENKHFHSSLPHQILIKDKNIKDIIVKDDPPNNIYFSTIFSDGTISVGTMSSPYENGKVINFVSDLFSNFILENIVNTLSSYFLFDLVGCIARDMFVCIEKDKFYDTQEVRAKSEKIKKKKDIREKVIWLPRFKLNFINRPTDVNYITEQIIKLSPAHVSGHPRKCQNPSQKQLDLAARVGMPIPPGHTYIKEHDRSGSREFTRLYKSRSALNLLYGA